MAKLRKIAEFENKNTGLRSRVWRDAANQEFVVSFYYPFGEHIEDSDYYTDDKQDAFDTAKHHLGNKEEEIIRIK